MKLFSSWYQVLCGRLRVERLLKVNIFIPQLMEIISCCYWPEMFEQRSASLRWLLRKPSPRCEWNHRGWWSRSYEPERIKLWKHSVQMSQMWIRPTGDDREKTAAARFPWRNKLLRSNNIRMIYAATSVSCGVKTIYAEWCSTMQMAKKNFVSIVGGNYSQNDLTETPARF